MAQLSGSTHPPIHPPTHTLGGLSFRFLSTNIHAPMPSRPPTHPSPPPATHLPGCPRLHEHAFAAGQCAVHARALPGTHQLAGEAVGGAGRRGVWRLV